MVSHFLLCLLTYALVRVHNRQEENCNYSAEALKV